MEVQNCFPHNGKAEWRALSGEFPRFLCHFVLSDFFATNPNDRYNGHQGANAVLGTYTSVNDGLRLRIHGAVIPEPEEYALVFGLFALAFVFFHRQMQKKKQRQPAVPTSVVDGNSLF